MQLPTYYRQVLPEVQRGSGAVRQQALVKPGQYISMAEQAGEVAASRKAALDKRLADINFHKDAIDRNYALNMGSLAGQSLMDIAVVVAAGIGAAGNLPKKGPKASVPNSQPHSHFTGAPGPSNTDAPLPKDSLILEAAKETPVIDANWAKGVAKSLFDMDVSLEDLRPEYNERAASFTDVIKAMASTAFPEVSNAFNRGAAMTAGNSNMGARGMNRQLEDRVSVDREITQMLQTESPEVYDERVEEIFSNQMAAAKEELPPEAYQTYYQQMMAYRGNKELSVAEKAGQRMYDDQKALQNNLLEAAILNGSVKEVDAVIIAGMTGYGNNPVSVYTEAEAHNLALESYKQIERNEIRQEFARIGTTESVNRLRARDDKGNYVFKPNMPLEERREYVKELIGIEETELRRKRKVSEDIEESVMAQGEAFVNGTANFRNVMNNTGPGLLGYERASLEAWYRGLIGDESSEMSAETNSALYNISMSYGAGEMSLDDAKAAIAPMINSGEMSYSQSTSFISSLKSDDSTLRRKPAETAKRLVEDYEDVTAGDESKLSVALAELMRTDAYKTANEAGKTKMEENVAKSILEEKDNRALLDWLRPESRDKGYRDASDKAETVSTQGFSDVKSRFSDVGNVSEAALLQSLEAGLMGTETAENAGLTEALKNNLLNFAEEKLNVTIADPEESLILYNGAWLLQYNGDLYFAEPQEYGVLGRQSVELVKYEERSKDWPAFEFSSQAKSGKVVPGTRYGGELITQGHFIRSNGSPQSLSREHTDWVEFKKDENVRLANPKDTNEWYLVNGESLTVAPVYSLSDAVRGQYDLGGTLVDVTSFEDYQVLLRSRNADEYYKNVSPSDPIIPRL